MKQVKKKEISRVTEKKTKLTLIRKDASTVPFYFHLRMQEALEVLNS